MHHCGGMEMFTRDGFNNCFTQSRKVKRCLGGWRRRELVTIFRNKGDVQGCNNYRGIMLISHSLKKEERVDDWQGKNTTDTMLALRMLKKHGKGQKGLHLVYAKVCSSIGGGVQGECGITPTSFLKLRISSEPTIVTDKIMDKIRCLHGLCDYTCRGAETVERWGCKE